MRVIVALRAVTGIVRGYLYGCGLCRRYGVARP
jgi:hypothetical protein